MLVQGKLQAYMTLKLKQFLSENFNKVKGHMSLSQSADSPPLSVKYIFHFM